MIGLRGDLCMSSVCARSFKEQYPDSYLTLGVGPQFKDLLPLFHDHPYFDATHVYSTYDGWPGPRDLDYLNSARYDIVFHGMPQHTEDRWYLKRHQYAETAAMVGLPIPRDIRPVLTRWFATESRPDTVAFAPFGGNGGVNDKMLTVAQAQGVVDWLRRTGLKVIHLGAPGEPELEGAPRPNVSYFEAVRIMLGCYALVHCDTGMGHIAGAYGQRSLGVYGTHYHGESGVRQIQPLHDAFRAVTGRVVAEIPVEAITEGLRMFLTS